MYPIAHHLILIVSHSPPSNIEFWWIGLTDHAGGSLTEPSEWRWTNGEPMLLVNWASKQPDGLSMGVYSLYLSEVYIYSIIKDTGAKLAATSHPL